jgi:hypothetical protein
LSWPKSKSPGTSFSVMEGVTLVSRNLIVLSTYKCVRQDKHVLEEKVFKCNGLRKHTSLNILSVCAVIKNSLTGNIIRRYKMNFL